MTRKVTLRTNKNCDILVRGIYFVERMFVAFIAMGYAFQRVFMIFHKLRERGHRVKRGEVGFQRLFHGGNDHLFQSVRFDDFPFRVFAKQRGDFVDPYFRAFLEEPFDALDVFGRGDGDVYAEIPLPVMFFFLDASDFTALGIRLDDLAGVESSFAVNERYLVTRLEAKHFDTVF